MLVLFQESADRQGGFILSSIANEVQCFIFAERVLRIWPSCPIDDRPHTRNFAQPGYLREGMHMFVHGRDRVLDRRSFALRSFPMFLHRASLARVSCIPQQKNFPPRECSTRYMSRCWRQGRSPTSKWMQGEGGFDNSLHPPENGSLRENTKE